MYRFALPVLLLLGVLLSVYGCGGNDDNPSSQIVAGWAIGFRTDGTAAIFHTANGGASWTEQGNPELWQGMNGNDISAVDAWTAWAALGDEANNEGMILQTTDGGATWKSQTLPDSVNDSVKGIKGLSRAVAWAVTLGGTVMRTLDGGKTWVVVPHEGVTINQVNRMDARGDDIWIADVGSGDQGMIHSSDFGLTWRKERLPDDVLPMDGPMCVSIVNSRVAWAAVRPEADVYRTLDGGDNWKLDAPSITGENDIDDICAAGEDIAWAAQNADGSGNIIRVRMVDGKAVCDVMDPMHSNYQFEGVTCFNENNLWVVGFKVFEAAESLPLGVILHTRDGGKTWTSQKVPANDVNLWKVSFAGAFR